MNQVICLVGVGNWTVHKVENLPPSPSRDLEREKGEGERGRKIDLYRQQKTCMPCHGLVAEKIHQTPFIKV